DYGLVPLEAMASSKPCLAKDEGGPKETIIHGRDGFLVESIWKLAKAMEWVARNPDKAASMGKAGRIKVETDFTWEKFLKRFEEKAKEVSASP
ncbi:glycosyltransferase, partial [Candidatus Micrarchaeota archaeon]|nr:glycosyltransferase [Candidatus Micrarchaeota archaeon]